MLRYQRYSDPESREEWCNGVLKDTPIRTRRSGRRSGRSCEEVALFYKPRREWMLAAIRPRREGKVGELRSLRKWPAGRGAYLLSLSAHCLAQ